MEEEKWLPVVGYEGLYEVSDFGRVRSASRVKRSVHSTYILEGKVMKQHVDKRGYMRIHLRGPSPSAGSAVGRGFFVHRLVAMAHLRMPTVAETDTNHIDFNTANNHVENLEWVTHQDNMVHSSVNGRLYGAVARGKRTSLTASQVASIREAGTSGVTSQHAIAKSFGVRQQTVSKILNGHLWTFGKAKGVPVSNPGHRARTSLNTRLSEESVRRIKAIGYTMSLAEIGDMFGVSRSCVQNIRGGTTWKDITLTSVPTRDL